MGGMASLTPQDVDRLLEGADLHPMMQVALGEAKEILGACLDGGVPAILGRDDHCTKGCSPKALILARAEDAPRIAAIQQQRWSALVATVDGELKGADVGIEVADGEPPCPACGTVGELVDGACAECGLQLG